ISQSREKVAGVRQVAMEVGLNSCRAGKHGPAGEIAGLESAIDDIVGMRGGRGHHHGYGGNRQTLQEHRLFPKGYSKKVAKPVPNFFLFGVRRIRVSEKP